MIGSLFDEYISESFHRVLQIEGGDVADGTGSVIVNIFVTSSHAISSSYAANAIPGDSIFILTGSSYNTTNDIQFTGSVTLNGAVITKTTTVTGSSYTLTTDDYRVSVEYSLTGSCNLQLPLITSIGYIDFKFKDAEGNALINNIHILASGSDTIDGQPTASLIGNYHALSIYNNGTDKWLIE